MSNEQDLYIIEWKSKITGAVGHGTKAIPFYLVKLWVEKLNKEHGAIRHHTAVKDTKKV